MSRPTIPPSGLKTPTKETVKVLQRRLASAEEDTQHLVAELTDMGFDKTTRDDIFSAQTEQKRIEPYTARLAVPEVLQKNYETIVTRFVHRHVIIIIISIFILGCLLCPIQWCWQHLAKLNTAFPSISVLWVNASQATFIDIIL